MKIAVVGSRNYGSLHKVRELLAFFVKGNDTLISGGATGVDQVAELEADKLGIHKIIYKPNWSQLGKKAGILRNKTIVENSDVLHIFWNGESRGTLSTINFAKDMHKKFFLYDNNGCLISCNIPD